MKAVNLIPADARRGDSAAGHSGGIVYVVLGSLAVLVVLTAAWAVMGKQIGDRRDEAAHLEAEATRLEARAADLKRYEAAAVASKARIDTVKALADGRFEWAHSLREISRVLPKDTWLTSINGTTASTGSAGTGAPATGGPSVELIGCTARQDSVARVMARLRGMDGVTGVKLASSEKTGAAGGSAGSSSGACDEGRPQFKLSVSFVGKTPPAAGAAGAAPAPAAGGAQAPAANGAPAPAANGAQAPAANGAPAPAAGAAPAPAANGTAPAAGQPATTSPTPGAAK